MRRLNRIRAAQLYLPLIVLLCSAAAIAHDISGSDRAFVAQTAGKQLVVYAYLGAKHMFTGYDHLLFLLGVIFFLYRLKDVATYVTLFAVGHSITLLTGVLAGLKVSPYLVDAIIGFSVVYKAFENIGGFRRLFGLQINPKVAVLGFGLAHGLGLATKLQDLHLPRVDLVPNMIAFNIGVEAGQLAALTLMVAFMNIWRTTQGFTRRAYAANVAMMTAGFVLTFYQLAGYAIQRAS